MLTPIPSSRVPRLARGYLHDPLSRGTGPVLHYARSRAPMHQTVRPTCSTFVMQHSSAMR